VKVRLSPEALDDLADISDWIERDDPKRAASFVEELRTVCRELGDFPRAFPAFPHFGPLARRRVYGNYLIVYDVAVDFVTVVAVVHGARNIDELERRH
jgi:plasmid stabilization system protein ParE